MVLIFTPLVIFWIVTRVEVLALPTLYGVEVHHGTFLAPLDMSRYGLGYTVSPQTRISAGDSKDGTFTKYEVLQLASDISYQVDVDPSNKFQLSKVPVPGDITYTYSVLEGLSTLHIDAPPAAITTAAVPLYIEGVLKDCTLDQERKMGTCVEERRLPVLVTLTGPAGPAATITSTTTYAQTYSMPLEDMIFKANRAWGIMAPNVLISTLVCLGVLLLGVGVHMS